METMLWCRLLILSVCARRAFGSTELEQRVSTEIAVLATTDKSYRQSRWQRLEREDYSESRMSHDEDYQDEMVAAENHEDSKAMSQGKNDYWGGYYDFLINEGSYKFWAVFQLATAALLIYSGFAALYYAKLNPQITDDEDDFLLRRRRRAIDRNRPPRELPFFGLEPQNLQRILDAIAKELG